MFLKPFLFWFHFNILSLQFLGSPEPFSLHSFSSCSRACLNFRKPSCSRFLFPSFLIFQSLFIVLIHPSPIAGCHPVNHTVALGRQLAQLACGARRNVLPPPGRTVLLITPQDCTSIYFSNTPLQLFSPEHCFYPLFTSPTPALSNSAITPSTPSNIIVIA